MPMISPCIFIDVDTQHDFFDPKGGMPVKNAAEIRENLKKLTQHALKNKITVISPVEKHSKETLKKGPYYCMAGTKGQKKISETTMKSSHVIKNDKSKINYENLLKRNRQLVVEKCNFDLFCNPHTLKLLKKTRLKNCVVFGVAIDYGLEQTILKLLEYGFKVWVPVDAVKAINEDNREPVMKELRSKGAEMWNTEFIISHT